MNLITTFMLFYICFYVRYLNLLLLSEQMFDIIIMDTFEISDAFPFLKKERWWCYDKKRNISIYYNSTIIFYSNHLTI